MSDKLLGSSERFIQELEAENAALRELGDRLAEAVEQSSHPRGAGWKITSLYQALKAWREGRKPK
jgi:hypothetical protein